MKSKKSESGFALLIMLMGALTLGGLITAGYLQSIAKKVEAKRVADNTEVLKRAKQAMLMYAYNYPVISYANSVPSVARGPGRLPCPDTDDDGIAETSINCSSGGPLVGRFPWNQPGLNSGELFDASRSRLWYAVSHTFSRNKGAPDRINSDSQGSINLMDTAGNIIFDASSDNGGIAAIIIAPGPAIIRADGFAQTRVNRGDPDPSSHRTNAANYLDIAFGEDNQNLSWGDRDSSNGIADTDGFILGPVYDPASNSYIVNDQMVIITADEVIAMAEKATLQAYRNALGEYQENIWGATIANYRYPWLDDYSTTDLTQYDADVNTVVGRVPSMFARYFDNTIDQNSESIFSDIRLKVNFPVNGSSISSNDLLNSNATISFNTSGDLSITPAHDYSVSFARYYWDEVATPDGWQLCDPPFFTNTVIDCNQAIANPGVSDPTVVPNQLETRVVEVTYTINFNIGTLFTRNHISGSVPQYEEPTASDHATVFFEYNEALNDEIDISFVYDGFYKASFDSQLSGNVNYSLGVRYYPPLPAWALANDWHNSIQMAMAQDYEPGGAGDCITNAPCLTVNNLGGINNNKAALLSIAGDIFSSTDDGIAGYTDDLPEIFEIENSDLDPVFVKRAGNDKILILREQ